MSNNSLQPGCFSSHSSRVPGDVVLTCSYLKSYVILCLDILCDTVCLLLLLLYCLFGCCRSNRTLLPCRPRIAVLARRSQLRLWCWLVRSHVRSAGYGRVEPLQDVSVSSVMISTIFDLFWRKKMSPRITIPNSGQTDFKTRKAIANVGNHQPLSESFPQAASCDNATCIHTFCNASMLSEVIETVV